MMGLHLIILLLQPSMMQAIERYMKQAIVDRNHAVASAALMSSFVRSFITVLLPELD